jgi:hypothetical protein
MSIQSRHHPFLLAAAAAVVMMSLGRGAPVAQALQPAEQAAKPATPAVNPDEPVVKDFVARVNQYVALHQKLEGTLPKLSKESTPEEIDKKERALAALIQGARANAKRGDLFTPEMTAIVKRLMAAVFSGPEGQKLRSSVMDENVAELPLKVNQRFPTAIPMATMPPAILKALPELPEEMQYRFVASQFVLLDPHANIVVDFIPAVISIK